MPPVKVIVQGFPWHVRHKEISHKKSERDKLELERFFRRYGRVECLYLWPETPYVSWRKWEGMVLDNFAQLWFHNADDAKRACYAAADHAITVDDHVLTLTRVSDTVVPIERLENEILVKIFSMLDPPNKMTIEKVCTHWKKLAPHSWRIKALDLGGRVSESERCLETTFEEYLKRCSEYLVYLTCDITSPKFFDLIYKYGRNLETLKLWIFSSSSNWGELFSRMFYGLPDLKSIEIHDYPDMPGFQILDHLPRGMEKVHLSYSKKTAYSFDVTKFRSLRSLSLRGFHRGLYVRAMHSAQKLTVLDFTGSAISQNIIWNITKLTELRTLNIPESSITDDDLVEIIRRNPRLECLDISNIPELTDRSLKEALWLTNLEVLKMRKLRVTLEIDFSIPSLKQLICEGCSRLCNWKITKLVDFAPKLRYMDLKNTPITPAFVENLDLTLRKRRNNVLLKVVIDRHTYPASSYSSRLTVIN